MKPSPFCLVLACLGELLLLAAPRPAAAWGIEGNTIIALVADRLLQAHDPAVYKRVEAILATDKDNDWTGTDIAGEAAWASLLLEKSPEGRAATVEWHRLELDPAKPDLAKACYGHPELPEALPAAHGPQKACIIDKIDQFAREVSDPGTSAGERLLALRFLLNLTGDLHQPLNAIDHGDGGGNCTAILPPGSRSPVRLNAYWNDTLVAEAEGRDPITAADQIVAGLTPAEIAQWSDGTLEIWVRESYDLAKTVAYSYPTDIVAAKRAAAARKGETVSCAAVSRSTDSTPPIRSARSPLSAGNWPRLGCGSPFCFVSMSGKGATAREPDTPG
jgi:S1/P1 Nuclease